MHVTQKLQIFTNSEKILDMAMSGAPSNSGAGQIIGSAIAIQACKSMGSGCSIYYPVFTAVLPLSLPVSP